jgi:hypothetical protein
MKKVRTIQAILVIITISLVFMVFQARNQPSGKRAGDDDMHRRLKALVSLPYVSLSEDIADSTVSGVVVHQPDEAYRGYNIYCSRVSPEVYLMDMDGNIVHRWSYPQKGDVAGRDHGIWDYAIMVDKGDILIIRKFVELMRLDWDSRPIWEKKIAVHHDVAELPDGSFYAIVREYKVYRGFAVRLPAIVHLTSSGETIDRWSTYDHFGEIATSLGQKSFSDSLFSLGHWYDYARDCFVHRILRARMPKIIDFFHLNTVTVLKDVALGETDSRFREGNLLVCFRNTNQLAILDKDTKKVLWVWGKGVLEWPHHPTMLSNGNILVFDNGVRRKYSKVVELDPVTKTIAWEYVGNPPESFYSYQKGSSQRLPNGNTLVCEGNRGRAFEITEEGNVVWEWVNPVLIEGHRAQVYRMLRLSPGKVEGLLKD